MLINVGKLLKKIFIKYVKIIELASKLRKLNGYVIANNLEFQRMGKVQLHGKCL